MHRLLAFPFALLIAGCGGFGAQTVQRDRFDYVSAISESWKQQMLLNLVKVRYSDAPVFLDVTGVINAYSLEGEVSLAGQSSPPGRAGDTFVGIGGTGRYADKPTITYAPMSGDKFAKAMMSPIPVTGILLLVQGGYPVDVVLRLSLNTVNGLENDFGGHVRRPGDPEFHELMNLLRESQNDGDLWLEGKSGSVRHGMVLRFRPKSHPEATARQRRIAQLLGLKPGAVEFDIAYGAQPQGNTEIALQSRSMLQVLVDISSHIDVPPADVADGRAHDTGRTPEQRRMFPAPVRVRVSAEKPAEANVAVPYRGNWFWVDDRDYRSKAMLSFLLLMFSLTETGTQQAAPVVTIPTR